MNWVDLALISVFFLFGLRGYFKGLFREVFSLAGLIAGFIAAAHYDDRLAVIIGAYWETSALVRKGLAFVAIFFMVYFTLSLVGWLLHRSEKALFVQTLNRLGGIAVGIGKGAAVLAFVVFFLGSASWVPSATRDKVSGSYLAPSLSRLAESMMRIGREKIFPSSQSEARELPRGDFA